MSIHHESQGEKKMIYENQEHAYPQIMFPVEQREVEYQLLKKLPESPFVPAWEEKSLIKQLLANDSLGGS